MTPETEQASYLPLQTIRVVDIGIIQLKYLQIKKDVEDLVINEMDRMMNDPEMVVKRD